MSNQLSTKIDNILSEAPQEQVDETWSESVSSSSKSTCKFEDIKSSNQVHTYPKKFRGELNYLPNSLIKMSALFNTKL